VNGDLVQRGEAIAKSGLRERAVPACAACHDPTLPLQRLYPRLDGQSRSYLEQQLRLFRDGIRDGTPEAQVMASAGKALSDADIDAVSAYYEQAL
jgi:cytochrome c oxidase subunit 1